VGDAEPLQRHIRQHGQQPVTADAVEPPGGGRPERAEAGRALRSVGRGVHPDFAESPRERAERLSQPAELVPAGDGWNGAVVCSASRWVSMSASR
jgi:hypothetical protein